MRVGASWGPDGCAAVLLSGTRVLASARAPGSGAAAVREALAAVCGGHAPAVRHLTLNIEAALRAAVHEPRVADGAAAGAGDRGAPPAPVLAVRIAPRPARHPALARHPAPLIARLVSRLVTLPGGHDLLGRELAPLAVARVDELATELVSSGVRDVAVAACGSLAVPDHERAVGERLLAAVPGLRLSLSHEFGGQDLLGREASAVLNAALTDVADEALSAVEAAAAEVVPYAQCGVARGDGGRSSLARVRALPVMAIGAAEAAALLGAARLAALDRCRVLLPGPAGPLLGEVRGGVPLVRSGQARALGVRLSMPTAILSARGAAGVGGAAAEGVDGTEPPLLVVEPAAAGPGRGEADRGPGPGRLRLVPPAAPADLALVGTALCQPMAWLDEVAQVADAAEVADVRRDAEQRAAAMVTAQGAAPGSVRLVEATLAALPFSPAGTLRVHVRAVGDVADPTAAATDVTDGAAASHGGAGADGLGGGGPAGGGGAVRPARGRRAAP